MSYILYDVLINPLPDRQSYIDLFTTALASDTDDELDAATPASWAKTPYRLWILAFARELKAYAKRESFLVPWNLDKVSKHKRYQTVNILLNQTRNNYGERQSVLFIVLREAVNCILNGQPGIEVENADAQIHLVIATTADGKYAGHITYYDNPHNSKDLVFIAIYKSVYCKACPKFSEVLLNYIETKAREMGKKTIHTRPIGPMADILIKHGFVQHGVAYEKAVVATGGKRIHKSSAASRRQSRRNRSRHSCR